MDLLQAIKARTELRALADKGNDAVVADAINAALPQPVPITSSSLRDAARLTLAAIKAKGDPKVLQDIGTHVANGDISGINVWSQTLHMLETMPDDEFTAVQVLIAAAAAVQPVTPEQVSTVLATVRHIDESGVARAFPIDWSRV